jgi:hypothetical protein
MGSFFDNAAVHEFVIIGCQLRTAASATRIKKTIIKSTARKKAGLARARLKVLAT